MLKKRDLVRLLTQENARPIPVCNLDGMVVAAIGASVRAVILTQESLKHFIDSHPDMNIESVLFLPEVIQHGRILIERNKPNRLSIFCPWPLESEKLFFAGVKRTREFDELMVGRFHRSSPAQERRFMRKCIRYANPA